MSGFPPGVAELSRSRLGRSVLLSVTLHGLIILGLSRARDDSRILMPANSALRVVVARRDNPAVAEGASQATPIVRTAAEDLHSPARKTAPRVRMSPGEAAGGSPDPTARAAVVATLAAESMSKSVALNRVSEPRDGYDGEDLRQYKLALAIQARRFKQYPAITGEPRSEGTTEVAVSLSPGAPWPSVALEKSSGLSAIDAYAVEIIRRASRAASIPSDLKQRGVSFVLPVHFSADD